MGLNHDPDTYKVSALPIELKHHVSALICVPANRNISHTLKSGVHENCQTMYMEPTAGIEPARSAWKADVLPLNYIGG